MAEQSTGVQNRGMLIVAIILAVIVVIAFNFFVEAVKNEKNETVTVLQYVRTLQADRRVDKGDVKEVKIAKATYEMFENLVLADEKEAIVEGEEVVHPVYSGKFVFHGDFRRGEGMRPDSTISPGKVAVPIQVGSAPGAILTPEGRINLVAPFALEGGRVSNEVVIQGVRVLGVAGGIGVDALGGSQRNPTSYRTVTVELDPVVHLQLETVLSHKRGPVMVQVVNRGEVNANQEPRIAKKLVDAGLTKYRGTGGDAQRYEDLR